MGYSPALELRISNLIKRVCSGHPAGSLVPLTWPWPNRIFDNAEFRDALRSAVKFAFPRVEESLPDGTRKSEAGESQGEPDQTTRRRGRPRGSTVNSVLLREWRGSKSQEQFAEACKVSLDTIQRGEAGETWSPDTFKMIAAAVSEERPGIKADDLKM
jgi:hypothetical protein